MPIRMLQEHAIYWIDNEWGVRLLDFIDDDREKNMDGVLDG